MLSPEEKSRYSRHIILDEVGENGQLLLKHAKVLIVGAGGLGAPLIQYLAAAGVGTIGIVDHDKVEDSNLQRQVLFTTNDIGRYKAEVAKERVLAQNPFVEVEIFLTQFSSKNALEIANGYDVIADGTDNFPTRYLVNDTCVILGIPNAYASIFKFEGQVTVFNLKKEDGTFTANYRDLYPVPPAAGSVPSCSEAGVMGVLPGIIGALQANEVIKIILQKDGVLAERLLHLNSTTLDQMVLQYSKNPDLAPITELIDYHEFCGVSNFEMETISLKMLNQWKDSKEIIQLIDVRTIQEHNEANHGGVNIPLDELELRVGELNSKLKTVLYCKSGARAKKAAEFLYQNGFTVVSVA